MLEKCIKCEREIDQEWLYCAWCGDKVRFNFPASRPDIAKDEAREALGLEGTIFEGNNLFEIWEQVKRLTPNHIVFIESGYMWEFIEQDATLMSEVFEWNTFETAAGTKKTGFPLSGKRPIEELDKAGYAYLKLERPDGDPHRRPKRCVTEVFPHVV